MSASKGKRPLLSYIREVSCGKRSNRLGVRLNDEEWEGLEREAREEGLNISSFVRRIIALRIGKRSRPKQQNATADVEPPSSKRNT
jgi:hypothetical protein